MISKQSFGGTKFKNGFEKADILSHKVWLKMFAFFKTI